MVAILSLIPVLFLQRAFAELPPGCSPLNEEVISTIDPTIFYEQNDELSEVMPPIRIGAWRSQYAIPTQHFAMNQARQGAAPIRQMPFSVVLDNEGAAYEAYTLDRWSSQRRSDEMQQQTPSKVGAPWDKVTSLGTNMKQIVSAPDGTPTSGFTGRSGLRLSIPGAGDPEWTGFGEMWADYRYEDQSGGSMQVALVRGSALQTHHFTSANPTLVPYCLSSVNGVPVSYTCPTETDVSDGGEGFLDGSYCSGGTLHIILRMTKPVNLGLVQWAATPIENWENDRVMHTCGSECQISNENKRVDITVTGATGTMAFAINVIGKYLVPPDWINNPEQAVCTGRGEYVPNHSVPETSGQLTPLDYCSEVPDLSPCSQPFCQSSSCVDASESEQFFKLVIQLDEAVGDISEVQVAMNTGDAWDDYHPMITCTPDLCSLLDGGHALVYCSTVATGVVKYAVNVIGRFVQPPTNWETEPFQMQCGGDGNEISIDTKFFIELDEPGDSLPDQTRKYVAYFSEEMRAILDASGLRFEPVSGEVFSGLVQLGYLGTGPRGDTTNKDFLDPYAGFYSHHPETTYCAQDGVGFINVDWNVHDKDGPVANGEVLTIVMPHQEPLLQHHGPIIDTPYTFKGLVADYWLMEEPLPRSSLDPTPEGVQRVKDNPQWHQNLLSALDRDSNDHNLGMICGIGDSYGVGKAIAMVTRAASISRAFETDHYIQLDEEIRSCLEKWLRIDDSLGDGNKFRYDTVYGGLLLRATDDPEAPIDPGAYYGFPIYADHHFHLAYFIYAAAYYVDHYPAWKDAHLERVLTLARDVGNPSRMDPYFPVVRHKDWYVGISWASGIGPGVRQAESSTEAINCYHALAALGEALGDQAMEATNLIQLATEIRSVREYYHVRQHNQAHFPTHILEYGTIGQFAESDIFLYTLNWPCEPAEFPMRHACLVGIQIIPIISVSGLYMDQEWAASVMDVCTWANDPWSAPGAGDVDPDILNPVATGWGAFCHSITSQYDDQSRDLAEVYVKDLNPGQLVGGTGVASTLLFIYAST